MFNPTVSCVIETASGRTNVHGEPLPGATVPERVSVVKIEIKSKQTPVSGTTTASHGSAFELDEDALLLFSPTTRASINDIVKVAGLTLRVVSKSPQFDLNGRLDHHEVRLNVWSAQ
ncbi:hypothetical protein [Paraburkholderia sp.]|uniref:hypothetical protein n=1 Tax=Paraburkholderia sp. TaxID=1926495 RepID=UPI0039E33FC2